MAQLGAKAPFLVNGAVVMLWKARATKVCEISREAFWEEIIPKIGHFSTVKSELSTIATRTSVSLFVDPPLPVGC
jgi:hypothetical protein